MKFTTKLPYVGYEANVSYGILAKLLFVSSMGL